MWVLEHSRLSLLMDIVLCLHSLNPIVETWKKATDQGKEYGVLLTDPYKAFECLAHDFVIAKLHAHGFSIESLNLINDYLTERKERVKINMNISEAALQTVLRKRCSENMQQIYRKAPMPKFEATSLKSHVGAGVLL